MKFADKFSNMIPIVEERESIMRGLRKKPCCMCGKPTEFIDVDAESYFCSEECMYDFYTQLWEGPSEI